jgi:hypothetical protein
MEGAMIGVFKRLVVLLALTAPGLAPGRADAQPPGYSGTGGPGFNAGMLANPYTNPYANPFMNPYMTQYSTSPGNAALYFFAAQQANGGIGSGRLSGVRPGPGAATAPPPRDRPDDARPPGVPSSVARYFQRGYQSAGTGPHYNRQGRYYSQNRR